jgi:addiction module HigA family antidote
MQAVHAHPGAILDRELVRCAINAAKLAASLMVPVTHVTQIIIGNRSISADMACRLGRYFGDPPLYWLGLQHDFDLALVDRHQIDREVSPLMIPIASNDSLGNAIREHKQK